MCVCGFCFDSVVFQAVVSLWMLVTALNQLLPNLNFFKIPYSTDHKVLFQSVFFFLKLAVTWYFLKTFASYVWKKQSMRFIDSAPVVCKMRELKYCS